MVGKPAHGAGGRGTGPPLRARGWARRRAETSSAPTPKRPPEIPRRTKKKRLRRARGPTEAVTRRRGIGGSVAQRPPCHARALAGLQALREQSLGGVEA